MQEALIYGYSLVWGPHPEMRNLIDRLLGWAIPVPDETVIDAKAEAKRLRENEALGQPVTEGDTPMITRKRGDFFNKIINF